MNKKSNMPAGLTARQQKRWESFINKQPAFRVWKSRAIKAGTYSGNDYDYVIFGYDLIKGD